MTTTKWAIDPTHTEIGFKVKHMMFTNVSGKFTKFDGTISTDGDDFSKSTIEFEADTNSVSTGNADRDGHLRSPDFFDAEKYPALKFKASTFTKVDEGEYTLSGDLTIRDVTKPVKLQVEYGGLMKDPWGNLKAGFTINSKISRKEWGLTWNAALEAGGVLVSDDVRLHIEVQLVKQAS